MATAKSFSIDFTPGAQRDLKKLPTQTLRTILLEIKKWLTVTPFRELKTRIKRLVGFLPPVYRPRIGDYRAYYRIVENQVVMLAVLNRNESDRWVRRFS